MRGILGPGTNRMNIYTIRKANVGFAKYVLGWKMEKKEELQLDMTIVICLIVLQLKALRF